MGHYASEMAGPGRTKEENLEILEKHRADLAARWKNGLRMSVAYPFSHDNYTCPQCYSKVESNFLAYHDEWHTTMYNYINHTAHQSTLDLY